MSLINLGPADAQLQVTLNLPAAGNNATTAIIDMQAIAGQSEAWRRGVFVIQFPALAENTANTGITVAMQVAPPSLTNSPPAPQLPVPGVFITPPTSQTFTCAAVAGTGSAAQYGFMTLAFDPNGSSYQFYQFVVTTPGGTVTQAEPISIYFVSDTN